MKILVLLLPELVAFKASEGPWSLNFISFKDNSLQTVLQGPATIDNTLWMLKEILWSEFMNSSSQYLQSSVTSIIFEVLMSLSMTWCWRYVSTLLLVSHYVQLLDPMDCRLLLSGQEYWSGLPFARGFFPFFFFLRDKENRESKSVSVFLCRINSIFIRDLPF